MDGDGTGLATGIEADLVATADTSSALHHGEWLVHHASCPVLIVPRPNAADLAPVASARAAITD